MPDIKAGFVTALYLFDVAQSIQLDVLKRQLGERAAAARLDDKSPGPSRLRYSQPPVLVDGQVLGCGELDGFKVRAKFYDYGVISLMLSRPFSGSWPELVELGQTLIENEPLEAHATQACQQIAGTLKSAMTGLREAFLDEDYLVFSVTSLASPLSADQMLDQHGQEIAQLLRGERQRLSAQEREFILKQRFSYLDDDLVIPAWNAAWIYDTEPAALAAIEILELANSQLLELRYHDDLLEAELTRLYAELQRPRWSDRYARRQRTKAALHVQALVIDVNELTDRLDNAVKFVGDPYAARLFANVGAPLGLEHWKSAVEEKLRTLDDIRRFAVDQTSIAQANMLELAIVAIMFIELGLFVADLMK